MIVLQSIPLSAPAAGKSIWLPKVSAVSGLILTLLLCGCASAAPWKKQAFALTAPATETGAGTHTNLLSLRRVTFSPLFEGRALVYRTGENSYEQDPYAEFLVPPNEMLEDCLRLYLRQGHAFAAVLDPDSGLHSSCSMAVSVNQLYGDFRQPDKPFAVLQMRFLLYSTTPADYGHVLWQHEYRRNLPVARRSAETLVAGWNAGLQGIMEEVNTALTQLAISETNR
jgi:uncharacterized lipoprotein YmbA